MILLSECDDVVIIFAAEEQAEPAPVADVAEVQVSATEVDGRGVSDDRIIDCTSRKAVKLSRT